MAAPNAKYGLFIPKKTGKGSMLTKATKRNVFGDDSDEESSNIPKSGTSKKVTTDLAKVKKQTQLEIDKAMLQDPTVYEYDAVYDEIQAEKIKSDVKEKNKQDKQPKYITGLLKMAEVRKREEERRTERKVQKEREEEGNQFADKEAFVTSAYKKKMLEQEEAEERERKEAALEAMLDVTKQKDLSGFYRYLYRETTGKETTDKHDEFKVKLEPKSDEESDDSTDSLVQRKQLKNSSRGRDREQKDREQDREQKKDREQDREQKKDREQDREQKKDREKYTRDDRSRCGRSRSRSPAQRGSKSDRSTYESKSDNRVNKSQSRRRSKSRSPQRSRHARDKHRSRSQDRRQRGSRSPDGRQKTMSKDRKSRRSHSRENEKEKGSKEEKRKSSSTAKLTREDPDTDGESDRPTNFSSSKDKLVQAKSPPGDLDRDDSLSESDFSEEEVAVQEETTSGSGRKQPSSSKDGDRQKAQTEKTGESKGEKSQLKYARHTSDEGVSDARKRFLARKLARERATAVDAE